MNDRVSVCHTFVGLASTCLLYNDQLPDKQEPMFRVDLVSDGCRSQYRRDGNREAEEGCG